MVDMDTLRERIPGIDFGDRIFDTGGPLVSSVREQITLAERRYGRYT